MHLQRPLLVFVILSTLLFVWCGLSIAAQNQEDLSDLSIEELMDVDVVTASRRAEPLAQVPGAIAVLDEEDIFRSGATSLPEVLKLVPGVHVAQVDTDKWAVGIRGFNGLLSNKHLVLLDGRSINSPAMAGVFWGNAVPISQVKRIEVVRGTWTSLWGAESFTGVINVISKTAEEMQGGKSVTSAGTSGGEQIIHLGDKTGETSYARGYVQGSYKNGNWLSGDGDHKGADDWKQARGGFRADWTNAFTDSLSFQSDIFYSSIRENSPGIGPVLTSHRRDDAGGYAQFVFDRATGLDANIKFRTSYSRTTEAFGDVDGSVNTLEAEVEHAMEQSKVHRITWGVGSRYFWDDLSGGDSVEIASSNRYTLTANGYVQDRITIEKNWFLFVGGKLDYFGDTPLEIQPSIRLLHTREKDEFWLAVSRAVRTDNRFQRGGSYSIERGGTTYTVNLPDGLKTEKLVAYEGGYRRELTDDARLDLSLYVNDYDDLMMLVLDDSTNTGSLENSLRGTTYGMEALVDWNVMSKVTLQPSLSLIYQNIYGTLPSSMLESMPEDGLGGEAKLQIMTQPTDTVGFDVFVGYLDGPKIKGVDGYVSLGAHASWQANDVLMLELIGKNLDGSRERFSSLKVGPSVDLRATWDF